MPTMIYNSNGLDYSMRGMDSFMPYCQGPIRDAELLAAEAFGAAKTWLLANGR